MLKYNTDCYLPRYQISLQELSFLKCQFITRVLPKMFLLEIEERVGGFKSTGHSLPQQLKEYFAGQPTRISGRIVSRGEKSLVFRLSFITTVKSLILSIDLVPSVKLNNFIQPKMPCPVSMHKKFATYGSSSLCSLSLSCYSRLLRLVLR